MKEAREEEERGVQNRLLVNLLTAQSPSPEVGRCFIYYQSFGMSVNELFFVASKFGCQFCPLSKL